MTAPKKTPAPKPAGVKQPSDRKPKADTDTLTVNVHGHGWTVSRSALDDFELLDDLHAVQEDGDATRLPSILRRLLGDGGFSEAMAVLRARGEGRVSIEAGSKFVGDLLGEIDPN